MLSSLYRDPYIIHLNIALYMVVPFGGKSHVSNGQNVSFKDPCYNWRVGDAQSQVPSLCIQCQWSARCSWSNLVRVARTIVNIMTPMFTAKNTAGGPGRGGWTIGPRSNQEVSSPPRRHKPTNNKYTPPGFWHPTTKGQG